MLEWTDVELLKQKMEVTRTLMENNWFLVDSMVNSLSTLQTDSKSDGYLRYNNIRDPKGMTFSERLAAGMDALTTSESVRLFNLVSEIRDISDKDKDFLEMQTDKLRGYLSLSNFHTLMNPMFKQAIDYGTACIYMAPIYGKKEIFSFVLLPAGSYWIRQNSSMDVDAVICEYEIFFDEFKHKYNATEEDVEATLKPSDKIKITHMAIRDYGDYYDIPFPPIEEPEEMVKWDTVSCTFANNMKIGERRLNYFPYGALRWNVADISFPWGINSPGQNAVTQLIRLFKQTDDISCTTTFKSKPPIIGPGSLKDIFKGEYPKAGTAYFTEGFQKPGDKGDYFQSVIMPDLDINGLDRERMRTDQNLEHIFKMDYVEQFLSLEKSRTSKAEIDERKSEKLTMMGTLDTRIQRDVLDKIIKFGLIRMGETENPDENRYIRSLEDFKVKPEYNTIINQAQKSMVATQLQNFMDVISVLTRDEQNKDMEHSINKREFALQLARNMNVSEKIIVNEEEFVRRKEEDQRRQKAAVDAKAHADMGRGDKAMAEADLKQREVENAV